MGEPRKDWHGGRKVLDRAWLRCAVLLLFLMLITASNSGFRELEESLESLAGSGSTVSRAILLRTSSHFCKVDRGILLWGLERMSRSFFILVSLSWSFSFPILAIMFLRGSMYFSRDLTLSIYSLSSWLAGAMGVLTLLLGEGCMASMPPGEGCCICWGGGPCGCMMGLELGKPPPGDGPP